MYFLQQNATGETIEKQCSTQVKNFNLHRNTIVTLTK